MNTIITPQCTLEPQVVAHASEMFSVLSDPAIYEFENAPPASEEWLAKRYERLESRGKGAGAQDESWLNWVVRIPSGELAGYVQATILSMGRSYVAYELGSRFWRKGLGTAALTAVLEELSVHYQIEKFVAVLKTSNYRSEGLLRKVGFVRASEEEAAEHRDESNETVMTKCANATHCAA